ELVTEGGETEMDKTVLDRLADPLVHLIRNCVDHGIEAPEDRQSAGKQRKGTITLSAEHSGDRVFVRVSDDGGGLDEAAILAKAAEKKLVNPESPPSGKDLFGLIFQPGFSTAKTITSVSGRGVGMDVVKKQVEYLRGMVEIESERGRGTQFIISLPLTLAIIDGLLVAVGDQDYVIPLSFVEECMELKEQPGAESGGRRLVYLRDEIIPYIKIKDEFRIETEKRDIQHMVVVRADGRRLGIVVDRVIGDYQTVIKSLGRTYRQAEGVSGATILGDGRVALIIDVPKLLGNAERSIALAA
ncbi:MAG: chemotaxis protein CheW, partial [Nitrospirota bacterium]